MTFVLSRRAAILAAAAFGLAASSAGAQTAPSAAPSAAPSGDPVMIGVSGPLTGQYAQYGAQWKKGFDLAVDETNRTGGIKGRPLAYTFEDTQSDPRQSVAVARKFLGDKRVVAEIGDFSSAASMAASPIYQAGGLVQFGFTNSHPDFTKGGDYMWSNAVNQADDMPLLTDFAVKTLGLKRIAVLFINSDWGRTSKDIVEKAVKERGGEVVASEGYLSDDKDFRSTIVRVREANPDGIMLISYYPDGAQIVRQIHAVGLDKPIVAAGSVYSPKFLELAGDAANGVYTTTPFFPDEPREMVRDFVKRFKDKNGTEPDAYNARAYDAMILLADVMKEFGPDRKAVHDGLAKIKDVPSLVFGKVTFDPQTRRVSHPMNIRLQVRDGKFTAWTGKQSAK